MGARAYAPLVGARWYARFVGVRRSGRAPSVRARRRAREGCYHLASYNETKCQCLGVQE